MSWYSSNYKQRASIAVDIETVTPYAGVDVAITIPPQWSAFWDNIRSDAFDVILVDSDNTLLTFQRASFTYATQTLTLEVDALAHDNVSLTAQIFLYWNYAAASDLAGSFTAAAVRTGKVFIGAPAGRIVLPDRSGSSNANAPSVVLTKAVDEVCYIWFEYQSLMSKRSSPYEKKLVFEEVKHAIIWSFDSSGTDNTGRYDKLETVYSNGYIGVMAKAGTNDTTYKFGARLKTTLFQEYELKCFLQIRNKYPPS